jgi:hypothetical protein
MRWYLPVIPPLGRQDDHMFKASLGFIARACLKNNNHQKKN